MTVIALNFNNKNQYRRYPFKQNTSLQAVDGRILGDGLIVNCSITSVYGKHRVYVKQVYFNKGLLGVAVASVFDDSLLGIFSGAISKDFTTLTLTPTTRFVSGTMTIGLTESLASGGSPLNFTSSATELEESTVFCYTPPAVTSIRDKKGSELRGQVNFGILTNITKTTSIENKTTQFTAASPAAVENPADRSSLLGNCRTPIIYNINGVEPAPMNVANPLNDGNIYIAGVQPVVFYGTPGERGVVRVETESLTLDSLCSQTSKLLPPIDTSLYTSTNADFKDKYYTKAEIPASEVSFGGVPFTIPARLAGSFTSANRPEYYFWPQLVKPEYFTQSLWPTQQ